MAKVIGKPTVSLNLWLEINEAEAHALDALTGYNIDEFIAVFKEKLGRAYLEPHEDALRSLFEYLHQTLPGHLSKASRARQAFKE
jgi:hypothetical protein